MLANSRPVIASRIEVSALLPESMLPPIDSDG
jgi:hypothetical protein